LNTSTRGSGVPISQWQTYKILHCDIKIQDDMHFLKCLFKLKLCLADSYRCCKCGLCCYIFVFLDKQWSTKHYIETQRFSNTNHTYNNDIQNNT
jgi:hypothetical protein